MHHSSRALRTALAVAGTLALPGVASAAPPHIGGVGIDPHNPRTTTPVNFAIYGSDPDAKAVEFAFDFAGGTSFGAFEGSSLAGINHTFGADAVHWITGRMRDTDGETTDTRFPFATHPDNWNPNPFIESDGVLQNHVTEGPFSGPQRLRAYLYSDDSPKSGWSIVWDLNNDGTYNGDGDGDPVTDRPFERDAHFTSDGTHPIKVKALDGQGGERVISSSVRTHTENEAPYQMYDPYFAAFSREEVESGSALFYADFNDDWSFYSDLTWSWSLDGTVLPDQTSDALALPNTLSVGPHTLSVTVTDDGRNGTETPGAPRSRTVEFPIEVVESMNYPADIGAWSDVHEHGSTTFRTLENIGLYAWGGSGQHVTGTNWDLDNDGQFDDAVGYGANFAAANKGTYKVAARLLIEGADPITLERTLVVDKGTDYAPGSGDGGSGGGGAGGGGTTPPVSGGSTSGGITPEQAKSAMITLLTTETVEFLRGVAGKNKKGINAKSPVLALGTLGAQQLPNGGTGIFQVFDKPASKKATAAATRKRARKSLGSTVVKLAKGESKAVKVKLNKKGKSLLKKKGKVKLTVDATLTDALTGAQVKQSRTYTFKVKKKRK